MVKESEELRDERQRGTKDGRRYLSDPGEVFSSAKAREDFIGRVSQEETYVHMPCCRRRKVRSELCRILTE